MDEGFSIEGQQTQLRAELLARAAGRQSAALGSILAGVIVVVYAHWDGPARTVVLAFLLMRLGATVASHALARRIVASHVRREPVLQWEWGFVLSTALGAAAWGFLGWMVPDLNYSHWAARDVFSGVALVFISSMALITLAHHRLAMVLSLCAQWFVACAHMLRDPAELREATPIFVGIMAMLAVMLNYGRTLHGQTRDGVQAELRNEELTERLQRSNAELERALGQAVEAASHDALTGVFNRRALYARADYLSMARRRQAWPGVVLLLDIDHFKSINDSFGHAAGDRVLTEVAAALRSELREMDVIARWGGEEFLVLMPDCELAAALQRAEDLRAAVARLRVAHLPDGRSVRVSIGVADWPPGEALDAVIVQADSALYRAKQAGRDRVMQAA